MNVYLGISAAGATWPVPWLAFQRKHPDLAKHLVLRWQTETLPNNSLVAREDVPSALVRQVAEVLFTLQHDEEGRRFLSEIPISRFEPATESTYEPVKRYLQEFSRRVRPLDGDGP